jgi:3-hydroxypropionyl-CoA synthetase (ADP-forming)
LNEIGGKWDAGFRGGIMSHIKSRSWLKNIENILSVAAQDGRRQLYEHEVYAVLKELGLRTPVHTVAESAAEISNQTLSLFGSDRIVLKVIAPGIAHKQKLGGVKVVLKDLDFVRYSWEQMRAHFENSGYRVKGILLAEFVEYSKDLGNEILLGFRESEAFGPVLSFSKGGTDAEHFAANFSAPNLILAPIDRKWAQAVLSSTRIQKKFLEEGKTDYITKIVDAEVKFSALATGFSNFVKGESSFVLKEFEINPFVFDLDGNFIPLDGYATFASREEEADLSVEPEKSLIPFFEPAGVAVVGLSNTDNTKAGNIIFKNLLDMKRDDVYGVNLKGGTALINGKSLPLYRTVEEIPEPVDLAVITVPAQATVPVIEQCARKGTRAAILIPGGFSETTKDRTVEEQILAIARASHMRIIGPNCLGIVYAGKGRSKGINTFFMPEEKFKINLSRKRKNVAILSQSGAMGIMEINNLRNAICPKVIVSYGNQLDVDPSDLVQYFEKDPMVDVMGLYIEGFKKGAGRKFFTVTSKRNKPIIVYKAGRTEAGKKATQSHTASISGEYDVAKAAMKQAGLIVADSMIDHGDFIKTFALLNDFRVTGNRVAVIANAGYEKTYAADNLGDLVLAELDEDTSRKLRDIIPSYVNVDPLLDLTAMVSDELFEQCVDILLQSPNVDALCISIVPQAQVIHTTDKEMDEYKDNIAARIVHAVHRHKKPTVVSVNVVSGADAVYNKFGQVMDSGGVPTFLTAERAMVCLNEFIRYRLNRERGNLSEWLR